MAQELIQEIVKWSADRPLWQQDALRRLILSEGIGPADFDELLYICKSARGLAPPHGAVPVDAKQLTLTAADSAPVTLLSMTHHQGVNALAGEQTIAFGPQVTVVYGQNAAGKSGYTRILKQACRARASEQVLGNVLQTATPLNATATLRYRQGATEGSVKWEDRASAPTILGAVSIFDAQCAPVYLRDKTDVAFRPMGLDLFDKLSAACVELRSQCGMRLWVKAIPRHFTFHGLRHTGASLLARAGVPIHILQRMLRHRSLETTNRLYIHLYDGEMRAAMEKAMILPPPEYAVAEQVVAESFPQAPASDRAPIRTVRTS